MDWKKIDQVGYLLFGRGYLYFNVFLDVLDFCKQNLTGKQGQQHQIELDKDDDWEEFMKWRSRHDSNVRPLDS